MVIQNFNQYLRELAKSSYYQSIYSIGKDINLKLFNNDCDLSDLQIMFLKYLNMYSSVHMDIAIGEITDVALENDVYTDSYLLYKNKLDKDKQNKSIRPSGPEGQPTRKWIFNNSKKVT